MSLNRRHLLTVAPLGAAAVSGDVWARALPRGRFTHGVASGDPLQTAVILWTRFQPETPGSAEIRWEVARDEAFRDVVSRGVVVASPVNDHCAKVDAGGLTPDSRYFYRFLSGSEASSTGQTRTAPAGGREPLRIAAFACANLPVGHFNPYAHAAGRDDVDVCVHVGDYIYEYAMSRYVEQGRALPGRVVEPDREIVAYDDYCARYASYRLDPDLQELHRLKPFICVWDDHEFANDSWMDGAQNHQPETEGDWALRKAAAAKAWFDWLPVRAHPGEPMRIHRAIRWGGLAELIMLDSRLVGRSNQPDWRPGLFELVDADDATFAEAARRIHREHIADPRRQMLGSGQEAWVAAQLRRSTEEGAPWQVLIEGSVLGSAVAPADLARFEPADASEASLRSTRFRARLGALGYPFDVPLWSGYPVARERFLGLCREHGRNVLAFGGETHSAWAFDLPGGREGRPAAVEVAVTTVNQGGPRNLERNRAFTAASPEVAWCAVGVSGYSHVTVDARAATAAWIGYDDVSRRDTAALTMAVTVAEASDRHGVSAWEVATG